MKKITTAIFVIFMFFTSVIRADEIRTWTSASGKQQFDAELVEVSEDGQTVTMRRIVETKMTIDKFSQEDRAYIAKQKNTTNQSPKVTPPNTTLRGTTTRSGGNLLRTAVPSSPPKQLPQQNASAVKDILRRQIDAVNRKDNGEVRVELSNEEKESIVQYLLLAEKSLGEQVSESGLSLLIMKLGDYKKGSYDFFLAKQFGREVTDGKIKYEKIDVYVVCLAAWSNKWSISGSLAGKAIETRAESKRYATVELARESAGASAAHSSTRHEVDIIESLLPECNRLSGNTHNAEEKERLGKKQRDTEKEQLFSKE